ncbi:MAG: hypothetical protein ACXWID_02350 [Pyrinomonadaceae bacterium]
MKHCPTCNFSFPDVHRVCDFDGTELVLDPERQSLVKVKPRFSYPRPGLRKPMLLTSLAVLGLFLSAVFIGYLESPAPSIPAVVKDQDIQHSPRGLTPIARTSGELAEDKLTGAPSRTASRSRNRSVVSSTARLRRKSAADSRSRNEVIARTQDSKRTSNEKSPKIVAVLKTTWKVLKKPFDF